MKSLLVNLLIVFSLILCAFNAIQWFREARLHGRIESLGQQIFQKSTEIQNLQQTVRVTEDEVKRLEHIRDTFGATLKSNRVLIAQIQEESDTFRRDAQIQAAKAAQVDQYKEAFTKANENLKAQNEIIRTQNDRMKELADGRNEVVQRFNKLAGEYQGLSADYQKLLNMYTNLVAQVQAANPKSPK